MNKATKNLCPRCGKARIEVKKWREKIGESWVTYTNTVCPDKACQKIVEEKIATHTAERQAIEKKRAEAKQARQSINLRRTIHRPRMDMELSLVH